MRNKVFRSSTPDIVDYMLHCTWIDRTTHEVNNPIIIVIGLFLAINKIYFSFLYFTGVKITYNASKK